MARLRARMDALAAEAVPPYEPWAPWQGMGYGCCDCNEVSAQRPLRFGSKEDVSLGCVLTPMAVVCGQMNTVAEEDQSRPVWPACPAHGWQTGVHRLTSLPNGNRLKEIPGGLTAAGSGSGSGSGFGPPRASIISR